MRYRYRATELGTLGIVEQGGKVTHVLFEGDTLPEEAQEGDAPVIDQAFEEIGEYLRGKRKKFEVPLAPSGTPFMIKCWKELRRIPYGEVATYGEIAKYIGQPTAARAVGMANNRNPVPLFIPCHRVVGGGGKLVGFRGGLDMKEKLLGLEQKNTTKSSSLDDLD